MKLFNKKYFKSQFNSVYLISIIGSIFILGIILFSSFTSETYANGYHYIEGWSESTGMIEVSSLFLFGIANFLISGCIIFIVILKLFFEDFFNRSIEYAITSGISKSGILKTKLYISIISIMVLQWPLFIQPILMPLLYIDFKSIYLLGWFMQYLLFLLVLFIFMTIFIICALYTNTIVSYVLICISVTILFSALDIMAYIGSRIGGVLSVVKYITFTSLSSSTLNFSDVDIESIGIDEKSSYELFKFMGIDWTNFSWKLPILVLSNSLLIFGIYKIFQEKEIK